MADSSLSSSSSSDYTLTTEAPSTIVRNLKLTYAQVVVSLTTAVGLLIICIIQLLLRSTSRHKQLLAAQRDTRFDGAYFLSQSKGSKNRRIVEEGLKAHRFRIVSPPQYDRTIPAVVDEGRDARRDCEDMLVKMRSVLQRSYGKAASLMSMRCCLACVKGVLPLEQGERFAQIYDSIVFGVQRNNGAERFVSTDDIKFAHAFFYNTVLKELE